MTFRPARDIRRVRWFYRSQLAMSLMWTALGLMWATRNDGVLAVLGGALVLVGVTLAVMFWLGLRSGVEVDARGLRWRGALRSTELRWDTMRQVVIDDRTSPYGTKVAIDVETVEGTRLGVPPDALAGLEEAQHADLRRDLLASVARFAEDAEVPVTHTRADGPLIS